MLDAAHALGPRAVEGAVALQHVLAAARDLEEPARLEAVNEFYNLHHAAGRDRRPALTRVSAVSEPRGRVAEWSSPLELLAAAHGSAEEYAIAKYLTLVAVGVPPARLRLVYVRVAAQTPAGEALPHLVVAYYARTGAEPLIIDTLRPTALTASQRRDLEPVFTFNSEGLDTHSAMDPGGNPSARLTRWRGVVAKARAQGLF